MTFSHEDIEGMKATKYRYLRCLDQKLWQEMRDVFVPEASAAYSGGEYSVDGVDHIIEFLSSNMGRDGFHSAHRVHHPEITFVDDDTATVVWAMDDVNVDTEFGFYLSGAGFYTDTMVRVDGARWAIRHVGYRRTFELIEPLESRGRTLTASWWSTDGRSSLPVTLPGT